MAKLSRPLRKALLAFLEKLPADSLIEDMLRHQSYWVWAGEFLHPHEYAKRFPAVARAFQIVRTKSPDGTPAPDAQTWFSRFEQATDQKSSEGMVKVLTERPGEFARRLDHVLRVARTAEGRQRVVSEFSGHIPQLATPVLVTLANLLPQRKQPQPIRIFWPKGRTAKGISEPDKRTPLPSSDTALLVEVITRELLARFASQPRFETAVIDHALGSVMAPFNERTASRSAITLPRGSRIPIPNGKFARLFLHWCEPQVNGTSSDLDLSVGFFDSKWNHTGVCSYYQLELKGPPRGALIARSAGDLRSAPWPDGATEFVDLEIEAARAAGYRYAVMVVNNFAGMPFSQLERGFAGLMFREDKEGKHFDPRTVELKFAVEGENGIFMPLAIDLVDNTLHWFDVQSTGLFASNNVETSKHAISKICPEMMAYFSSGVRASVLDLALLHAAARCKNVYLRDRKGNIACFVRGEGEPELEFLHRLKQGRADKENAAPPVVENLPWLAFLYRGDLELPKGSASYALFQEQVASTFSASDLVK